MPFKSDRQRRGFYGNMNRVTYPHAPPQGMLMTDSHQSTVLGTPVEVERPRKIKPLKIEKFADTQVMLRKDRKRPTHVVSSPEAAAQYVRDMEEFDREVGVILHLDTKNNIMGKEVVSTGSLNAAIIHPREVFKGAILNNSAGIIFVHNHPSGDPTPSQNDVDITRRLRDTGHTTGIELMDSVVIGQDGRYYSMREQNVGGF